MVDINVDMDNMTSAEGLSTRSEQSLSSVMPLSSSGINFKAITMEASNLIFRQAINKYPAVISGSFRENYICIFTFSDIIALDSDCYQNGKAMISAEGDEFIVKTGANSLGKSVHLCIKTLESHLSEININQGLKAALHSLPLLDQIILSMPFNKYGESYYFFDTDGFYHKLAMLLEKNIVKSGNYKTVNRTRILYKAKEYITSRLANKISLSDIASYCSCSPRTLSYTFEYFLDCTAHEYIQSLRLLETYKSITLNNNKKIGDIYDSKGIIAKGRFSSEFKDHFGIRPVELRKLIQHMNSNIW